MIVAPPHGDLAHARQEGLRDLPPTPLHRPPAVRALGSGKRRVPGLENRPVRSGGPGQRIVPKLQLHRVEIGARTVQFPKHAVEALAEGPCGIVQRSVLQRVPASRISGIPGQGKQRFHAVPEVPDAGLKHLKLRPGNLPGLDRPAVANMMNPCAAALRQHARMRRRRLRTQPKQRLRDPRVPQAGRIPAFVLNVRHLLQSCLDCPCCRRVRSIVAAAAPLRTSRQTTNHQSSIKPEIGAKFRTHPGGPLHLTCPQADRTGFQPRHWLRVARDPRSA